MSCIKTCLDAVQRRAISIGRYTFSFFMFFLLALCEVSDPKRPEERLLSQAEREREGDL